MAGLFSQDLKMEDTTGVDYPEGQLITEGDEGESVAAAIMEVTEEEAGVAEDERAMDQLVEDGEAASEIGEVLTNEVPKTEHSGLTPSNARLAKLVMGRILGNNYVERKFPKFEHFNSRSDARDNTSFVTESIKDALKSFWETLKAQFKKIWAKMKSWYVKTFSAAKKLNAKAVSVRDRAEGMSSTIDKKNFQFSQVKVLSLQGKLKSPSEFETALKRVADIIEATHKAPTDSMIDKIEDAVDGFKKELAGPTASGGSASSSNEWAKLDFIASEFGDRYGSLLKGTAQDIDPSEKKLIESLGGGDNGTVDLKSSEILPGDKMFVVAIGKGNSGDDLQVMRSTRAKIANTKFKPKEISADAEAMTLNTSQIASLCNIIVDSTADIYDYEQKWQKVDRQQETYLRKVDELVRDIEDGVKDAEADDESKQLSKLRTFASTTTNFIKATSNIPNIASSYAMGVYAATLNWCEGSMRNYK